MLPEPRVPSKKEREEAVQFLIPRKSDVSNIPLFVSSLIEKQKENKHKQFELDHSQLLEAQGRYRKINRCYPDSLINFISTFIPYEVFTMLKYKVILTRVPFIISFDSLNGISKKTSHSKTKWLL